MTWTKIRDCVATMARQQDLRAHLLDMELKMVHESTRGPSIATIGVHRRAKTLEESTKRSSQSIPHGSFCLLAHQGEEEAWDLVHASDRSETGKETRIPRTCTGNHTHRDAKFLHARHLSSSQQVRNFALQHWWRWGSGEGGIGNGHVCTQQMGHAYIHSNKFLCCHSNKVLC